ncbi:hypothetical protein SNE40_013815 [Patella caerulea]|uniref:Protein kinase domain-containing protein n=1 Tax=Patella caerulea TaxID=87958 RepID=A0AAN8JD94_PATCE
MNNAWFIAIIFLIPCNITVLSTSNADEFPQSDEPGVLNQMSPCQAKLNTGGLINLKPLSRSDGAARFHSTGRVWNYSFNPCSSYNEPKDPHTGFGDGCSSVLMCVFGLDSEKYHYYTLGIERTATFRLKEGNNKTDIQLVLRGTKSMRHRVTFLSLVCDRKLVKPEDAVFEVNHNIGRQPVTGEIRHICCCPDGCPLEIPKNITNANQTEIEPKPRKADKKLLLIVVVTNLGLLFLAALIGGLCYIKRTHVHQYKHYKGLQGIDPNARRSISGNNKPGRLNRPSPYSDWEPSDGMAKKKLFPVLEESEISIRSLEMSQRLGGGIFGDTHIAKWNHMNVAVKRLTLTVHENQLTPKTMEYMKSEVWKLSRLRHKLIVTVLGLCLDSKMPYIITEYVEGECLQDFIKVKGSRLTWPQRVKICTQIADGIAFLHSCKPIIIHRDLRCGNLFILDEDIIKVADFGLTKLIQPMREECTQDDCCCMREYSACPAMLRWTAPELLSNPTAQEDDNETIITSSCDVYSFGMVMWEIYMMEEPFEDLNTEQEIIEFVTAGGRPELPVTPDLLVQYKDLMVQCWSQQPQLRLSSKQVAVKLKEMMQNARAFQKSLRSRLHKSQHQQTPPV